MDGFGGHELLLIEKKQKIRRELGNQAEIMVVQMRNTKTKKQKYPTIDSSCNPIFGCIWVQLCNRLQPVSKIAL